MTGVVFAFAFSIIAARLIDLAVFTGSGEPAPAKLARAAEAPRIRADITDRNGILLATSLPVASLYANPRYVPDAAEAAAKLARVLPGLDQAWLRARLESARRFVWLRRNLTPKQQFAVNSLGIPGLDFKTTARRIYPQGNLGSHVLGFTDVDGNGLSGVEAYFDGRLKTGGAALRLSIDVRLQAILHQELARAMETYSAVGAASVILDAETGEVLALASLPDFDPNRPSNIPPERAFNRVTMGVYEMGSTFKLFTLAMALDSGRVGLGDRYDARQPIKIARFRISDYHGKNRWLSVPEILVYSSNIGAAKMALDVGTEIQQQYLKKLGLLQPARIELPEVGLPLKPRRWREINTMTISYGHGIAVSPMQMAAGVAALVNGGILRPPTLIRQADQQSVQGERVLTAATSAKMRRLMRLVVRDGTGGKADVEGYRVGGKTGTADKLGKRGYRDAGLISSFIGVFPARRPKYVILVLLDEPKGTVASQGFATGGWVAAPAVGAVVRRMAPLLGVDPDFSVEALPRPGDPLFIAGRARGAVIEVTRRERAGAAR